MTSATNPPSSASQTKIKVAPVRVGLEAAFKLATTLRDCAVPNASVTGYHDGAIPTGFKAEYVHTDVAMVSHAEHDLLVCLGNSGSLVSADVPDLKRSIGPPELEISGGFFCRLGAHAFIGSAASY